MNLSANAQAVLAQHFANTAAAFGAQVGQTFTATPSVAQTLYKKVVDTADPFLGMINVFPVTEIKGDKIGMSLSGRVAGRTDTAQNGVEREPKLLAALGSKTYECFKTEFDVAISYAMIDMWSKFPNFVEMYMQAVRNAIGLDMLQIGWTGETAEVSNNISTNPLYQDMNVGWLQQMRDFDSGSHYIQGTSGNPIVLGSEKIRNLDVLAFMAKQKLPTWYRNRSDLVLLVGADILASQEETYLSTAGETPLEKAALNGEITRKYAGMPTMSPSQFPVNDILVTPLKNLSIYYQDSSVRRLQKDKPEKDQVQDFNSANHGYVVEDENLAAYIENVTV